MTRPFDFVFDDRPQSCTDDHTTKLRWTQLDEALVIEKPANMPNRKVPGFPISLGN